MATTDKLILDHVLDHAAQTPDRIFLTQPIGNDQTIDYTWAEVVDQARRMAAYLQGRGFEPGARIAMLSKNCAHFFIAELAIWMAGYTTVAIFPTETSGTVRYVLEHSEASLLFVGKLDTWGEQQIGVPEGLPCVAFPLAPATSFETWDAIIERTSPLQGRPERRPEDLAMIMYTSGSTGTPKGVMISFKAITVAGEGTAAHIRKYAGGGSDARALSYLPLAHSFERSWVEAASLVDGSTRVYFAERLDTFLQDLQRARPTLFISVPRLWLKFQQGVFAKMPPAKLDRLLSLPIIGKLVGKKVRRGLGLDQVRMAGSGSAPIPADLIAWYRRIGLPLYEGYGMTEDNSYSHTSIPGLAEPGYVGVAMPGVQVKISPEGEILIKSPARLSGYYKRPDLDAESFTEDGYFRTGDLGELRPDGLLKITGRAKELFKTAKGKYIAPAPIENLINAHPMIELSMVSGVGQPSAYAIVVLAETLRPTLNDAAVRQQVHGELERLLTQVNAGVADYAQLRMLVVAQEPWSIENGCLTPTMKIRRMRIEAAVEPLVDQWFAKPSKVLWGVTTNPSLRHGGDRVAQALQAHGVPCIYTLCGGHISPILSAAKGLGLRIVDVRDEATAVFAADAAARLSGRPGVAAVTAGPGITNTITALKNAQLAQSPLLLLGGAAPTALQGRGALQDIDQRPLVEPHVKRFFKIRRVRELGPAVAEAMEIAQSGVPGPVFIECPVDLLYDETSIRGWYADAGGKGTTLPERALRWYLNRHVQKMFEGSGVRTAVSAGTVVIPRAAASAVGAAAAALARAERPLFVIGSQAVVQAAQADALAQAVTTLGVPVYLSGMARGLLGRDHPLQRRHARRQALRESDCVLLAGVPCDFRLDYGKHVRRSATLIAANRSAKDARLNRRPSIAAIGDAGDFIQALAQQAPAADPAKRVPWLTTLRERDAAREAEIDTQAAARGAHVNPLAFFRMLERTAGEHAVFVADGGDFVATASYVLHPRRPLTWLDPGAFGTLGVGAGFALGAATTRPDREVWIVFGDGACGYGLAEFDTFVRHGIPVVAVVGNDAGWTQIAREQVKMLHDDVATVLARTDYHAVAAGFGAEGIVVKTMDEVQPALDRARELARQGRPVLVNVWLDKTEFREGSLSM